METAQLIEMLLHGFVGIAAACLGYLLLQEYQEATSSVPDIARESETPLADFTLSIPARTFFFMRLIGAVVGMMILSPILGVFGASIIAALIFFIPLIQVNRMRQKRVSKVEAQLVDALELLGNSLKSGLNMVQAIELVVKEFPNPIKQEFAMVLAETRLGVEFTDALKNMGDRLKSNIVQVLATGVIVTKRCGGDLTVIFSNIAQTIRELATIEGKLNAVTAQGRFQGLVLGMMPFALIVILYFIDRSHVETLFGFSLGRWAVGAVILMVIMAQLWIKKLLAIDV